MKRTIRCGDIKDKLVFIDSNARKEYHPPLNKGTVVQFFANYNPTNIRLVVVGCFPKKNTYAVIFPRMRIRYDGKVFLGQDKLQENWNPNSKCMNHWEEMDCSCDSAEIYTSHFQVVSDHYEYQVLMIKNPRNWYRPFKKDCVIDHPLWFLSHCKQFLHMQHCERGAICILAIIKRKRVIRDVLGLIVLVLRKMKKNKQ